MMEEHAIKRKRKKKDNFLRKAKKFEKKGKFAGGYQLDVDQLGYYIELYRSMKQVEAQEKELLVKNLLTGLIEKENLLEYARNQLISRILDDSLRIGRISEVLSVCQIFTQDIRAACIDPYASHVLQTLMVLALKFTQENARTTNTDENGETDVVSEEQRNDFITFLEKVGRFVYNNLEEFISHTYACYVFRTLLETVSGAEVKDLIKSSQKLQTYHAFCHDTGHILRIPSELQTLFTDLVDRLFNLPDLLELISYECSSVSLQTALVVLKSMKSDKRPELVNHLLQNGFAVFSASNSNQEKSDLSLFENTPAVRLLEVMMSCATDDQLNKIYTDFFKGHMDYLVKHRAGNFAVQKLLTSWQSKEMYYDVFQEVQGVIPAAYEVKNTGVILAVVQACQRLEKSQMHCWKIVMQLLNCNEPQERQLSAAPCLLWFLSYDEFKEKHAAGNLPPVSLHGALILQEFLRFKKPLKIVNSVEAMSLGHLELMACDPRGSHVITAFFASKYLKLKHKENLTNIFKGKYVTLACSKHGSRSLDSMWDGTSVKTKTIICEELVDEKFKLKGNQWGSIIHSKFKLDWFRKDQKTTWLEQVEGATKKKRLLDDLLSDVKEEKPSKKKKKLKKDA